MAILHCTLATRDVSRSVAFFNATLGWRPIERPTNTPVASAWLEIADGQELHLIEVADVEPCSSEGEYGRHIAVSYPLEGFEDLKKRLKQHGAVLIDPKRSTPFERFFFRDPVGYVFEVIEEKRR